MGLKTGCSGQSMLPEAANVWVKLQNPDGTLNFIGNLVQSYYYVDGKPLGEKNPKWLQDDYVKFIRFAQWRIERTGQGVLAMITNHSYLDNPTFRGMRQQLMQAFSEVYILDLHGNAKKKESAPDGSKDENVFDIEQGVAVCLMFRKAGARRQANVYHADLYGLRTSKYDFLTDKDIQEVSWAQITPHTPSYLFVPQQLDLQEEYEQGWSLPSAMPLSSAGIVTARDGLTIQWTAEDVLGTVRSFVSLPEEEARRRYDLGEDVRDWKIALAQDDIRSTGILKSKVSTILYRPFDIRYTYYTGKTRGFICMPRPEVMSHMLAGRNLAIIATRQTRDTWGVLATKSICGHKSCAAYDINSLFPLYLHCDDRKSPAQATFFDVKAPAGGVRRPNFTSDFLSDLGRRLDLSFVSDGTGDLQRTFGPEDVFHYMYAIFHSPTYRTRYAELLKRDFPRLPLTRNVELFRALAGLGNELVALHLLESPQLEKPITKYPGRGDYLVAAGYPKYEGGSAWINQTQRFEGIPETVWNFYIGGYQVCHKWLKDRRGRALSAEDRAHYAKIVVALKETIRLMGEIDEVIEEHGGWPIE